MKRKNLIDFKFKITDSITILIYFHTDLFQIYKYSVHNKKASSMRFLFLIEYLEVQS